MRVKTDAQGIAEAASAAAKAEGLPPVHLWNPPFCGDLDMEIRRDGTWFYNGTPIGRPELVKLFSSILRKEGAQYFLVTPVEKVGIRVLDAPFVAIDAEVDGLVNPEGPGVDRVEITGDVAAEVKGEVRGEGAGQRITFTTQVGDKVEAGPDNPIRVERDPATGEPSPYVMVRAGLEALIDRKTFYRLVDVGEVAEMSGERWFGLRSGGAFFPIIPADELDLEGLN